MQALRGSHPVTWATSTTDHTHIRPVWQIQIMKAMPKEKMWSRSDGVSGKGLGSVGGGSTTLGDDGKDKMRSSGGVSGGGLGSVEGGNTIVGGDGKGLGNCSGNR